jgi:hypothetical protein
MALAAILMLDMALGQLSAYEPPAQMAWELSKDAWKRRANLVLRLVGTVDR